MTVEPVLRTVAGGVAIFVRVTPRASKAVVGPVKDGRLAVRVTASPVDHAANDATLRAVADALAVPRRAVQITSGFTSRHKTVQVTGLTAVAVARALNISG